MVYAASRDGSVYALHRDVGTERWSFDTDAKVMATPVVAGETVLVGSGDGTLYALDAETGNERWAQSLGRKIESSPAVVDGSVYIGSSDGRVYALSEGHASDEASLEWSSASAVLGATGLLAGTGYTIKRFLGGDTRSGR